MIQLIIGLVAAGLFTAGVWAGWANFTNGYRTEGAIAQKAEDQKVVNLAEARAVRAESDAKQAALAAKTQSEAVLLEAQRGKEAQQAAQVIGAAYAGVVKSSEARVAGLKATATAAVTGALTCEETLAQTDTILRGSARVINRKGVI